MDLPKDTLTQAFSNESVPATLRRVRLLLALFIACLVISGATAIPLETELKMLAGLVNGDHGLAGWLAKVRDALIATNAEYSFLAYGTDWLAFGHFVIAIAFIGPWRDPVKNIWIIEFGLIACVLVIPFALLMGEVRGIPWGWRLIDCLFGIVGFLPLWFCRKQILKLGSGTCEKQKSLGRQNVPPVD